MSYRSGAVVALSAAACFCSNVFAQDTYTQGASAERRAPAETMPEGAQRTIDARDIQAAIEDEIYHDVVLSLDDVDVRVEGNVATLSGEVESLMAKSRAADIAATVKGVSAVVNRLVVQPPRQRSGEELESAVTQALVVSPATESFQVQVKAGPDGAVTLSGNVDSWAERELAERAASTVAGVTDIKNEVQVKYTGARTDAQIATEIKRMLHWDAYVDDTQVDVEVRNGVVTLSGSVGSASEKNRAKRIAWTAGTKDVDAQKLRVDVDGMNAVSADTGNRDTASNSSNNSNSSSASNGGNSSNQQRAGDQGAAQRQQRELLSDASIQNAVQGRLGLSPYSPEPKIDVRVENGVVTLSGTVANLKAKRVANLLASQTQGVLFVRDRLGVRMEGTTPSDTVLKDRIDGALAVNTITESYEIAVDVNDGEVTLSGQVDSWFEKGVADDVAASVQGVRSVDNDLVVEDAAARLAFDPYVDDWSVYDHEWYQPAPVTVWKQDEILRREIQEEMWWSPFVDENEINIEVDNGVATLTGTVDSVAEANAARENAFEGGVAGVIDKLDIED